MLEWPTEKPSHWAKQYRWERALGGTKVQRNRKWGGEKGCPWLASGWACGWKGREWVAPRAERLGWV